MLIPCNKNKSFIEAVHYMSLINTDTFIPFSHSPVLTIYFKQKLDELILVT